MKQLALVTTQNVVIEYPAATVMERIVAAIIDLVILFLIAWVTVLFFSNMFQYLDVDGMGYMFIYLLPILMLMSYHAMSEYFANGQTLGKKILGIRVVRMDGQRAGLRESLIRSVLLIVDFVFSMGFLGILVIATSKRRQRLGDLAANTFVIKSNPHKPFRLEDIEKIKTTEEYEAVYPQVIQFTEADILQVKETLSRAQKYKNSAHRSAFLKMTENLALSMGLEKLPKDRVKFVKTIIRDYIVLTR